MRRFLHSEPLKIVLDYLESEGYPAADFKPMNSDHPKKDVRFFFIFDRQSIFCTFEDVIEPLSTKILMFQ